MWLHWHEGITSTDDLQNVPHNVAHNTQEEADLCVLLKGEITVLNSEGSDLACPRFFPFHILSHILFENPTFFLQQQPTETQHQGPFEVT